MKKIIMTVALMMSLSIASIAFASGGDSDLSENQLLAYKVVGELVGLAGNPTVPFTARDSARLMTVTEDIYFCYSHRSEIFSSPFDEETNRAKLQSADQLLAQILTGVPEAITKEEVFTSLSSVLQDVKKHSKSDAVYGCHVP